MKFKINALVVDNDVIAQQIKKYLEKQEITEEIWCANNGSKACELIEQHRPDLVLLNLKMPDMSGFDVIERFKDTNIKFVIVSGFIDIETTQKARYLNVVGIIDKPFTYQQFVAKIDEALHNKSFKESRVLSSNNKEYKKTTLWHKLFK